MRFNNVDDSPDVRSDYVLPIGEYDDGRSSSKETHLKHFMCPNDYEVNYP